MYRLDILGLAEDVLGCRLVRLQEEVVEEEEDRPRREAEAAAAEEVAPALYIVKLCESPLFWSSSRRGQRRKSEW